MPSVRSGCLLLRVPDARWGCCLSCSNPFPDCSLLTSRNCGARAGQSLNPPFPQYTYFMHSSILPASVSVHHRWSGVTEIEEGIVSWKWSYRQLWGTIWVLRTKLCSSGRVSTARLPLHPLWTIFFKFFTSIIYQATKKHHLESLIISEGLLNFLFLWVRLFSHCNSHRYPKYLLYTRLFEEDAKVKSRSILSGWYTRGTFLSFFGLIPSPW